MNAQPLNNASQGIAELHYEMLVIFQNFEPDQGLSYFQCSMTLRISSEENGLFPVEMNAQDIAELHFEMLVIFHNFEQGSFTLAWDYVLFHYHEDQGLSYFQWSMTLRISSEGNGLNQVEGWTVMHLLQLRYQIHQSGSVLAEFVFFTYSSTNQGHDNHYDHNNNSQDNHTQENQGQGNHGQENQDQGDHAQENQGQGDHAQENQGQENHAQDNQGQENHAQENQGQENHAQDNQGQENHAQDNQWQENHAHEWPGMPWIPDEL